jgi:hypothetical protein
MKCFFKKKSWVKSPSGNGDEFYIRHGNLMAAVQLICRAQFQPLLAQCQCRVHMFVIP